LQEDEDGEGFARAPPVRDKGADNGAGQVEEIDDNVPGKGDVEGVGVADDVVEPGGGVDAKGVGAEIVNEPDNGDDEQAEPVEPAGGGFVSLLWSKCVVRGIMLT
jgi:hypothetical protein